MANDKNKNGNVQNKEQKIIIAERDNIAAVTEMEK